MDPNRSLHRHREQFPLSRGLAGVYWLGRESIFGTEKKDFEQQSYSNGVCDE